jgi:PIN domain
MSANTTTRALPKVCQQALIDRVLKRRKPFNESGNGYRDALIWETILGYGRKHRRGEIAFLTANTEDFCEGTDLHQHLVEDLVGAKLRKDYVKLFTSLQDFVSKEVIPRLPRPHADFVKYTTEKWPKFRLGDSLLRLFEDKLQNKDVDRDTLGKPYYIGDPTIEGVYEPDSIEVLNERRTKQKNGLVPIFDTTS